MFLFFRLRQIKLPGIGFIQLPSEPCFRFCRYQYFKYASTKLATLVIKTSSIFNNGRTNKSKGIFRSELPRLHARWLKTTAIVEFW